jgi:hypothetical protein
MSIDDDFRQRMVEMAQKLLDATRAGKITWRLTDVGDKFIYAGTRSSVTIEYDDHEYATILCLLNEQGNMIDSIETGRVQTGGNSWEDHPWNDVLEDLHQAARRVVYNVDDVMESMMSDIARGTPSPPSPPKERVEDPWASDNSGGYSDEPPF